ncbi:MAG: apolipoprotein N-acyltransferase [Candidatus Margulisiibacteriota bacterium]|nr:apolipoprotein N-acyltransferase [Candidatus Margulisiibacteriota bacterium]
MKFSKLVILSALSGILLALAFPKFNLFWIAWFALVPLFIALGNTKNWKESVICGFFFGTVFFGIHLSWMNSLFRFVGWWVVLGWASLILFQTLFILLFALIFRVFISDFSDPRMTSNIFQSEATALVGGRRKDLIIISSLKRIAYVFFVAVLWIFIEWLRAWGPFGVTGGVVGYTQVNMLPLIQIASFSSVYGVSFIVVMFNVSLALFVVNYRKWQPLFILSLIIALCVGHGMQVIKAQVGAKGKRSISDVLRGSVKTVRLSLIQPNIDQKDKLDASMIMSTFNINDQLTRKAAFSSRPDIVVWPETAVFAYLLDDPILLAKIRRLLIETNTWLITGTPFYREGKAYNSIVSFSPRGEVISRYDKERPVPFSEYLPFRKLLYPLLKGVGYYDGEFSANKDPQAIEAKRIKIAAAICFESTFPSLIRKRVENNSDFILVLTNDAWFGDSSAPYYHINTGVFRAIENRKYFIQVGNSGVSAVIDPYGRILRRTDVNRRGILTFEIPLP